jgi:hypothetical protein
MVRAAAVCGQLVLGPGGRVRLDVDLRDAGLIRQVGQPSSVRRQACADFVERCPDDEPLFAGGSGNALIDVVRRKFATVACLHAETHPASHSRERLRTRLHDRQLTATTQFGPDTDAQ